MITRDQQKLIHALINDIAKEAGYISVEYFRNQIKESFAESMDYDSFSLSAKKCSKADAKKFINYLLECGLEYGILSIHPLTVVEDIEAWVGFCMRTRTCCVTGLKEDVDIHWVDKYIDNGYVEYRPDKYLKMPLVKSLHHEIHQIGYKEFIHKYAVRAVKSNYQPEIMDDIDERKIYD